MTKRDRVFNLLEGKPVDRLPTGFWFHFPEEQHHGDAAVRGHIDLMAQSNTDIFKIMNENLLYDGVSKINSTSGLGSFRRFTRKSSQYTDQAQVISRICEQAKGEYPIAATVHGLVASAFHQTGYAGRYTEMGCSLAIFCRERPQQMKAVFETVADSLIDLVDCSLDAGADGIFYAALGGERHYFSDEEFAEFIAPWEKRVYDYIQSRTKLDILHICKANIALERYVHLKPSIVNWSIYQNGVSLRAGQSIFPDSIVLGGFQDRQGVLVDGSAEDIDRRTGEILAEMDGAPFIVGSDCTLPTDISIDRIRQVVSSVERLSAKD